MKAVLLVIVAGLGFSAYLYVQEQRKAEAEAEQVLKCHLAISKRLDTPVKVIRVKPPVIVVRSHP